MTRVAWRGERQTYLGSDAGYQLDHVLVTSGLSGTVRATDLQRWDDADVASGDSPDHACIASRSTRPPERGRGYGRGRPGW